VRPSTSEPPSWPTRLDRGTRALFVAIAVAVGVVPLLLVDPADGVVDGYLAPLLVPAVVWPQAYAMWRLYRRRRLQQLAEVRARQASTER